MAMDAAAEFDLVIPQIWSDDVLAIVYQEGVLINRIARHDRDIAAYGDTVNLPGMDTVSVNNVTQATGAVTDQDITLLNVALVINKWTEATIQVVNMATMQARFDVISNFKQDFSSALIKQIDTDIAALYTDVTTNVVGDATTQFNEDIATAAIGKLLDTQFAGALRDPNRVSFCLHSSQWKSVKKVSPWNEAQITGEAMGGTLKMTVPNVYGVPLYFSTVVASDGGNPAARQNLLFLREAFCIAIQKEIQFTELVSTGLAKRYNSNVLYGVKTRSQARAVLIKTAA